jgi:hypothetical protein
VVVISRPRPALGHPVASDRASEKEVRETVHRDRVSTWAAATTAFVLGSICFSLIGSAWAVVAYGVLVLGVALIYRITGTRSGK